MADTQQPIPDDDAGSVQPVPGITVVADSTGIYADGKFFPIGIHELLHNETAVRQLINQFNSQKGDLELLRTAVIRLETERARTAPQPLLSIIMAVVNAGGAVLIGLGVNYISGATTPPGSGWIVAIGIAFTVIANVGFLRLSGVLRRKKEPNAAAE